MPTSNPNSVLIAEVNYLHSANKKLASNATLLESQLESSRIYVKELIARNDAYERELYYMDVNLSRYEFELTRRMTEMAAELETEMSRAIEKVDAMHLELERYEMFA